MTKSILIRAVINGSGIVNFDSNNQKYSWNRQQNVEKVSHDNVSFGKGRYYLKTDSEDPDKQYLRKVGIISADCIRHAMYEDCMATHLPNVMHDDMYLLKAVAHPAFVERGYLFAKDTPWKRKSALALSYAKAIESSIPMLETFSNNQPKTGKNKSEDAAETSFFKREVRGDTTYELSGAIDLGELGFLSLSETHDRLSFHPDYSTQYRTLLGKLIGSNISAPSYYQKNGDVYDMPEYGILLTSAQVQVLVLDILKRLARFSITRTVTGNAYMSSVQIKFVNDPLTDLCTDDTGWLDVFDGKRFNDDIVGKIKYEPTYTSIDLTEEALAKIEGYAKKYGKVIAKEEKEDAEEDSEDKPKRGRKKKGA